MSSTSLLIALAAFAARVWYKRRAGARRGRRRDREQERGPILRAPEGEGKGDSRRIEIVVVTSKGTFTREVECIKEGLVAKPFVALVNEVLEAHRVRVRLF